ncbi:MAG: hypothetical protein R3F19_32100 [Verrucomicrobiales bacterium]
MSAINFLPHITSIIDDVSMGLKALQLRARASTPGLSIYLAILSCGLKGRQRQEKTCRWHHFQGADFENDIYPGLEGAGLCA